MAPCEKPEWRFTEGQSDGIPRRMEPQTTTFPVTPRTRIHRMPARGTWDRAEVNAILDAGLVCHVGLVHDGLPVVIPMAYARVGDDLVLHGARASRLLRGIAAGAPVCCTVTLLDGLVLARSAFHHSVNYRSVMVHGCGSAVDDPAEKAALLAAFVGRIAPGRPDPARPANAKELGATLVVRVPIVEAVAKRRSGPPLDDAEDMALPVWAGVVPLHVAPGPVVPDAGCLPGTTPPAVHWPAVR
jgi:hypothetical protein